MVTANENLNLVQNMYKALNKQDLDAHDDYWTKDMIWHGPPGFGDIFGREAFKYEVLEPLPLLVIILFYQKHLIKGITTGSVKG